MAGLDLVARRCSLRNALGQKSRGLLDPLRHAAVLAVGIPERAFGRLDVLLDLGKLLVQRPQDVRALLELPYLCLKRADLDGKRLPIEITEGLEHGKLLQLALSRFQCLLSLLVLRELAGKNPQALLKALCLLLEGGDLGLVRPAENISRAIVQSVTVVLFVPLASALDLAGAGQRLGLAAKCVEGLAARIIEALDKVRLDPGVEAGIRPDRQLADERLWMKSGERSGASIPDAIVDDALAQMRALDPSGHRGIVLVRNEDRHGVVVQQPLDRSLPCPFLLAHLHQLADERQIAFVELQGEAEVFANAENPSGNVRLAIPQ